MFEHFWAHRCKQLFLLVERLRHALLLHCGLASGALMLELLVFLWGWFTATRADGRDSLALESCSAQFLWWSLWLASQSLACVARAAQLFVGLLSRWDPLAGVPSGSQKHWCGFSRASIGRPSWFLGLLLHSLWQSLTKFTLRWRSEERWIAFVHWVAHLCWRLLQFCRDDGVLAA